MKCMKDGVNATPLPTVNTTGYIDHVVFSSRRRHTRFDCDWSSDVCSSDLDAPHCAPALTAITPAITNVPNIIAIARTIPFIGSPLLAGSESQDSLARPELDCRRGDRKSVV